MCLTDGRTCAAHTAPRNGWRIHQVTEYEDARPEDRIPLFASCHATMDIGRSLSEQIINEDNPAPAQPLQFRISYTSLLHD